MKRIATPLLLIVLLVIFFIPIALNFILASEPPAWVNVVGENKDWLMFWGAYIASVGTFIIIYQTYKNHDDLKMLQIKTLEFSYEQKRIDDLRVQLIDNFHTVDKHTFLHAIEYYRNGNYDKAYEILIDLNKAILHQKYKTYLYMRKENLSDIESDYVLFLNNAGEQFACLAGDMQFLVSLSIDFPKAKGFSREALIAKARERFVYLIQGSPENTFPYEYYSGDNNIYKKIFSIEETDDVYDSIDEIINNRINDIGRLENLNRQIFNRAQQLIIELEKNSKNKLVE